MQKLRIIHQTAQVLQPPDLGIINFQPDVQETLYKNLCVFDGHKTRILN